MGPRASPHPYIKELLTPGGIPFYVNLVSGEFYAEHVASVRDVQGGLLCDDPGTWRLRSL